MLTSLRKRKWILIACFTLSAIYAYFESWTTGTGAAIILPLGCTAVWAMVIGLSAGVGVAVLWGLCDGRIVKVTALAEDSHLPLLTCVPWRKHSSPTTLGFVSIHDSSSSQFSEAFRLLSSSLLQTTTGKPSKLIAISSANPAEGKTTVAIHLASILCEFSGKVLLIDGDLRRPCIHSCLGVDGTLGLSTVLSGGIPLSDAVQSLPDVPGLDVLCSGLLPPFPTEMLSSSALYELLLQAREVYTHIVMDSPPILSVVDGVILAQQADANVLIVRDGKTRKHSLQRALALLTHSDIRTTGLVLNFADN